MEEGEKEAGEKKGVGERRRVKRGGRGRKRGGR